MFVLKEGLVLPACEITIILHFFQDADKQEKLYTYFVESFRNFFVARSKDSKSAAVIKAEGEFDYIMKFTESRQRATYRFQVFVLAVLDDSF